MDSAMLIEIFGYIGSALVVISMLMSSVVKLRIINTIGSIVSGTYAVIVGAFPLVLMNGCLIIINLYNLFKLLKTKQEYDLIDGKADDAYLNYFLEHYKNDIQNYFPGFSMNKSATDKVYVVCCEGNPAGLLLGKNKGEGTIDVMLDYATPAYRDCSVGTYLYSKLAADGVRTLVCTQVKSKEHEDYLAKMGFAKENGTYVKKLG